VCVCVCEAYGLCTGIKIDHIYKCICEWFASPRHWSHLEPILTASMASWLRALDFLTHGDALRKVGDSNPGRENLFQLVRFSPLNICHLL